MRKYCYDYSRLFSGSYRYPLPDTPDETLSINDYPYTPGQKAAVASKPLEDHLYELPPNCRLAHEVRTLIDRIDRHFKLSVIRIGVDE